MYEASYIKAALKKLTVQSNPCKRLRLLDLEIDLIGTRSELSSIAPSSVATMGGGLPQRADSQSLPGGGVTAGIDFALTVAAALYGEEIAKITQLLLEYNPAPPFDIGSPKKAGADLRNKAVSYATQSLFQDRESSLASLPIWVSVSVIDFLLQYVSAFPSPNTSNTLTSLESSCKLRTANSK